MLKYLLLPSIAFAKTPFIDFNDLLKNMTFDKVNTNDHDDDRDKLIIEHYDTSYCENFQYDEQLYVRECMCGGDVCYLIDNCGENHFTVDLFYYEMGVTNECDSNYHQESIQLDTNSCQDGVIYYCSNPDSDSGEPDGDNTQNLYDYIEMKEYNNNNCNGNIRRSDNFEINECKCNNEEGWCVYPLYCNNEFIEVELYMGSSCKQNNLYEILKFEPNTCVDGSVFTCHHDDDHGIHWIVAMCISIASFLCCCGFTILFVRCCFVQNPCGRSNVQQVQPPQVQVQQPPQIMVQQPQQMNQPQQIQMVQQPQVYQVAPAKHMVVSNIASAPPGNPLPAYTYPHLNDGESNV